jgi:ribose transport system ATP-binding protein
MALSPKPLLQMRRISKTFPGVKALDLVDLDVRAGEVHAVAGENGAGKSTLMKIMTGVFAADPGGEILIDDAAVTIRDPLHARDLGLSIIYQELSMVDEMTVAENIFLAREPRNRIGLVDKAEMNRRTAAALETLQVTVSPTSRVRDLSVGQKQMIEIAKAISYDARVLVMDEPTASLSQHESDTLLQLIRKLRERGIAIIYITHRLEEIFAVADRVTVLRDGRTFASQPIGEVTRASLVRAMVDRDLSQLYASHPSYATKEVVLSVRGLTQSQRHDQTFEVRDVDFDLHKGEVLGLFGLIGSGRTEMMEMIFGVRAATGSIRVAGREMKRRTPVAAMALGLGFATEDRKAQGLVLGMSVRENITLTHLENYCRLEFVNRRRESAGAQELARMLGVKTPSIEQKVVNLSGGNQQKVVIAKWIARQPRVLIVDEPTRGIDVGAKAEVHALLARLAEQGVGVIVVSSDLPEILAVSDRVLVIKKGRVAAELPKAEATQERIMEAATA